MKSHRQFVRRLRRLAIGLVAIVALIPVGAASALREPGSSPSAHNAAANVGDTPADFPGASRAPSVALTAAPKVGDTPADFPGASGAPAAAPQTIEVVRPETTVVRDVNEALPIVLSGAALLIVLMGAAFVLVRVRLQHRHAPGRSH
jgi:FtsP/CotA-like multicopper oxidase with cupredoxin domain